MVWLPINGMNAYRPLIGRRARLTHPIPFQQRQAVAKAGSTGVPCPSIGDVEAMRLDRVRVVTIRPFQALPRLSLRATEVTRDGLGLSDTAIGTGWLLIQF